MDRSAVKPLFALTETAVPSRCISPGLLRFSTAAGDFLTAQGRRGISKGTLAKYRQSLWSLVEFLSGDYPTQELGRDVGLSWLTWLRETPAAPRRRGTLPKEISPETVRSFLTAPPPRSEPRGDRCEQTIGTYWRYAKKFLASLGCDVDLPRHERPNLAIPPPLVPTPAIVVQWWSEYLADNRPRTQRVVLMQALLMLTGMRLGEALAARLDDVEGHWLLVRKTKTHAPRILYLSRRALGIAQALRQRYANPLLIADAGERLAGWLHTVGYWHTSAQKWTNQADVEFGKRNQAMRRVCSTYLYRRNPTAESLQLGHGSGVVLRHYVDAMRMVPPLLEKFPLPRGERIGMEWPAPIVATRAIPARLYEEFRRLVSRRRSRTLG
jgi:integrase